MPTPVPMGYRFFFFWVLIPFLLLTGCGDSADIVVDPRLRMGDGLWEQGKRILFPAAYWRDKAAFFGRMVAEEQKRHREATQAYHDVLSDRRREIAQAVATAVRAAQDPSRARREVIGRFREKLDPLRERSKEHARAMRDAMDLVQKAREQLKIALIR
ncbi:MAG: hypothetical protein HQL76_00790 [Magnetococcales bacterium]|nr:hypothetical protein [Magnetococcales bacterium]